MQENASHIFTLPCAKGLLNSGKDAIEGTYRGKQHRPFSVPSVF